MTKKICAKKYILEIRYNPLIQAFDRRGRILEEIWKPFESKMRFWSVENVAVKMQDTEQHHSKQIIISHMNAAIVYENPGSEKEFLDDANKFLKNLHKTFPEISFLTRIGFRYIEFNSYSGKSIEDYSKPIRKKWLLPTLPTTLPIDDLALIFEHKCGRVAFGSAKQSDQFLANNFTSWKDDSAITGIYMDIDSYSGGIDIVNDGSFTKSLNAVTEMSFSVRSEISGAII